MGKIIVRKNCKRVKAMIGSENRDKTKIVIPITLSNVTKSRSKVVYKVIFLL